MINVELLNAKLKVSDAALKLLVLDACRDDPRPPGRRSALGDVRFEYGLPPDGVVSIKSCSRGKIAHEDKQLGHGVFMHFLLEGLDGKAAGEDGSVTLGRLFDYASRQTDKYVVDKFGDVQCPVMIPERVEQIAIIRPAHRGRLATNPPKRPEMPADRPTTADKPSQAIKVEVRNLNPLPPIGTTPEPGPFITNSIGMKLVLIPAGEFLMGSPDTEKGRGKDEVHSTGCGSPSRFIWACMR